MIIILPKQGLKKRPKGDFYLLAVNLLLQQHKTKRKGQNWKCFKTRWNNPGGYIHYNFYSSQILNHLILILPSVINLIQIQELVLTITITIFIFGGRSNKGSDLISSHYENRIEFFKIFYKEDDRWLIDWWVCGWYSFWWHDKKWGEQDIQE